jgi:hypothetical protein
MPMKTPMNAPRVLLALALSAVLASGAAIAQQASANQTAQPVRAEGGMHDRMMQLDTDHDGRISRKEAGAKPDMAQRFDKMDANHDGFLDRGDFQAHRQQQRDSCFAKADSDKDGKLDRGEFDAAHRQCRSPRGMHGPGRGGDTPPPAG